MGIKMRFCLVATTVFSWSLPDCDQTPAGWFTTGTCTSDAECPAGDGCHNAACARPLPGQPCQKLTYGGGRDCRQSVSVCAARRERRLLEDDDQDFDSLDDIELEEGNAAGW